VKLGHPVPFSNLAPDPNSALHSRRNEIARPFLGVQRAGSHPFRAVLAQHVELRGIEPLAPFLIAAADRENFRRCLLAAEQAIHGRTLP
jgi:hypothetical protein